MDNIYLHILDIQQEISLLALATVTGTIGSTPQKPGSSALFDLTRLVAGTVGGGVLEGEVHQIAQRAIRSKESGYYLIKLEDVEGLRALALKFPEDVLEVQVDTPGILRDMDTPEEYMEAINQINV